MRVAVAVRVALAGLRLRVSRLDSLVGLFLLGYLPIPRDSSTDLALDTPSALARADHIFVRAI